MKPIAILTVLIALLFISCGPPKDKASNSRLFAKDNLVAWCVVPFDSLERAPAERAVMLKDLGFTQLAYDWRVKHLPTFADEVKALRENNISMKSVWFWVTSDSGQIIDRTSQQILDLIKANSVTTELWVCFEGKYFEGLPDDLKLAKADTAVKYIYSRAKELGCGISLYNHGDWFGEPDNQIKIIESLGLKDIGMVYNFHHAHQQVDRFPELVTKMLPYLSTVNIDGMKIGGPQILPVGQGDKEFGMLKVLKDRGYKGSIGIIGHVENADVKVVLQRNLDGFKTLLEQMGDKEALSTY